MLLAVPETGPDLLNLLVGVTGLEPVTSAV